VVRAAPGEAGAGGRLNAAIGNAALRLLGKYARRGPPKAQAFFRQNVVVVVMEEQLTRAERTLVAAGRREIVHRMRRELRMTMRADLTAAAES
jgi:uncharacterized protein YbcI